MTRERKITCLINILREKFVFFENENAVINRKVLVCKSIKEKPYSTDSESYDAYEIKMKKMNINEILNLLIDIHDKRYNP
jgi:hypothetical protein